MILAYLLFILISIGFTWLVLWFAAGLFNVLLNPFITFIVVFLLLFYLMTRK